MTEPTRNLRLPLLHCSKCGVAQEAACDCGAGYVPPSKYAATYVAKHPELSDRAIAEELGINHATVSRARKRLTVANATVGKRTGRDGKARKQPKPRKPKLRVVQTDWAHRTNVLSKRLDISDFATAHAEWLKENPPEDARISLYHNLQTCAEELLRLASDTLPSIETAG